MEATVIHPWTIQACDRRGDTKKKWFVRIRNVQTGLKVEYSKGLNSTEDPAEKYRLLDEAMAHYRRRLLEGWRPVVRELHQFTGTSLLMMVRELQELKAPTLRPATVEIYRNSTDRFHKFLQHEKMVNIRPEEFGREQARKYYNHLASLELSGTSKNTYFRTIRTLVNQATGHNPWHGFRPFREQIRRHTEYSQKHLEMVTAALKEHSMGHYIFFCCIYYLGIRRTELCRLLVGNVYPERGLVYIPATIDKTGREHWVAIPSQFRIQLYRYLSGADPRHYLFGTPGRKQVELRPGPNPKRPDTITQTLSRILERLGIADHGYTLYSAKHTAASRLLRSGTNIYDIKTHLRHSKVETTQKYVRSLGYFGSATVMENYPDLP